MSRNAKRKSQERSATVEVAVARQSPYRNGVEKERRDFMNELESRLFRLDFIVPTSGLVKGRLFVERNDVLRAIEETMARFGIEPRKEAE